MRRLLPLFARFFFRLSRHVFTMLAGCVLLSAGFAQAQPPALAVESVREVAADPSAAEVELVLTNDTRDPLYLTVTAKSRDGVVRSVPATTDDPVPAGRHRHVTLFIGRPGNNNALHTDVLWVSARETDHPEVFIRTRVDWPHDWPASGPTAHAASRGGLLPRDDDSAMFAASLGEEDFAAVDLLLNEWNTPTERNPNGEWKLEGFRAAVDYLVLTRKWDELQALLGRWRHAYPHSPGAALALAEAHWRYGWTLRGCACGPVTRGDSDALKAFRQQMHRAQRTLDDSRQYATVSPLWYEIYLNVQGDRARDRRSMRVTQRVFDEGVARYPLFQPLYLAMARYWAPNDGRRANWRAVEAVADAVAANTRATDGDDNYAWLYAQLSRYQQLDVDIVRDSAVSWPRLRASFNELVKRHPSVDNYNLFTVFACRAGDMRSYFKLRDKIQGHVERDLWPDNYSLELCDRRLRVKNWM